MNELPPYLVASLARVGRQAMTQEQIAAATGWSLCKVAKVAALKTWADVTIADADRFRIACGVSRAAERRARFFVRRSLSTAINSFNHLRKKGGRRPKFLDDLLKKSC